MHIEALDFCWRAAKRIGPVFVAIEFGARDVNGSARACFPDTDWTGLDLEPGPGVDIVGDACTTQIRDPYTLVVSTEMLEHCTHPRLALQHMVECATQWVLITCATHGRAPHSAVDGGPVRDGEHYRNVDPCELEHPQLDVVMQEVHADRGDLYFLGRVRGNH